jgi:hypothetical protein
VYLHMCVKYMSHNCDKNLSHMYDMGVKHMTNKCDMCVKNLPNIYLLIRHILKKNNPRKNIH